MKKYFLLSLLVALTPSMVFGASARYSKLLHEKQRKMEQLEKCMGVSKGLQVAGVSTLGLTAVGVAGNIYEAKLIKENDAVIEKKDKRIKALDKEIKDIEESVKATQEAKELAEAKEKLAAIDCRALARKDTTLYSNPDKIETARKDVNNGTCEVLTCYGIYRPSDNGKTCVPNTTINSLEPESVEEFSDFINSLSYDEVTIGSSISVKTEWLSNEDVKERVEEWKSFCEDACDINTTLNCYSEQIDTNISGDQTIYACKIGKCIFEDKKFKKSEDGLKCIEVEIERT